MSFKSSLKAVAVGLAALAIMPTGLQTLADTPRHTLVIQISDIENQTGTLRVALFRGEAAFKSNDALAGQVVPVDGKVAELTFDALEPGSYGVKLYHDVNDDGKLNTGMFGIPKEPWAFSNNAQPRMGPPSWNDAAFDVSGETTQLLSLQ